jgi:hypothetical protein
MTGTGEEWKKQGRKRKNTTRMGGDFFFSGASEPLSDSGHFYFGAV